MYVYVHVYYFHLLFCFCFSFCLKNAGIRKTYVCSFCKEQIKAFQKYVKCSGKQIILNQLTLLSVLIEYFPTPLVCQIQCHLSCANQLSDSCVTASFLGLPPLAKRLRNSNKSPDVVSKPPLGNVASEENTGPGHSASDFMKDVQHTDDNNTDAEPVKISTTKRQKNARNSPEAGGKSLKQLTSSKKNQKAGTSTKKRDSICRDVNDKDTKPGPDELVPPPLVKRQRAKDKEGRSAKKTVPSGPLEIAAAQSIASSSGAANDNDNLSPSSKAKELKSVTIVPIRKGRQRSAVDMDATFTPTPPQRRSKRNISSASKDLDLSIRSSMFGSPSDTSFI